MPPSIQRRDPLPQKITDIAQEWWDLIFDGRMWWIDGRVIPASTEQELIWNAHASYEERVHRTDNSCLRMRNAAIYRANKRGLRITGVTRHELLRHLDTGQPERVWCLFLQAASRDVVLKDVRWDRSDALPAPPMPIGRDMKEGGRGTPRRVAQIDQSEVIERLLATQTGPPAAPASFATHRDLQWYARQCTCDTPNMRVHAASCPVYPLLGMLERVVNRLELSPEAWAERFGKRIWSM